MKKKKLLFVCSENLNRSPTAESLFKNNKKYIAKSAGLGIFAHVQISNHSVDWADIIFVMDEEFDKHKTRLLERFPDSEDKIKVLNIPDIYPKNNLDLISILKKKLKDYLE